MAAALAERMGGTERAAVVHGDDFYRPMPVKERLLLGPRDGYDQYFDWQRLRDQVLVPLNSGRAAHYQRYDWPTGALAAGELHHIPRSGIVIVEGVYAARPELAGYYDLAVLSSCPHRHRRGQLTGRGRASQSARVISYTTWPCSALSAASGSALVKVSTWIRPDFSSTRLEPQLPASVSATTRRTPSSVKPFSIMARDPSVA